MPKCIELVKIENKIEISLSMFDMKSFEMRIFFFLISMPFTFSFSCVVDM